MPSEAIRRALVIDDERALASVVASYLERDGFEVHLAFDGPEGLDSARSVDPDVVVLDLGRVSRVLGARCVMVGVCRVRLC